MYIPKRHFQEKIYLKIQKFSRHLASTSGSKGVAEINGKEHEELFHPHFIHEGFTSLVQFFSLLLVYLDIYKM